MSHRAIAAVLAREDLAAGERLVTFSLASFADREARARPGAAAAAGRAGLRKSAYLEARDRLLQRGLVAVEQAATGRGRASTLWLPFAEAGPWWEGEVNAELFEAVLSYSRAVGSARLLLAAAAALADERRVVESVTTEQLSAAAGVADRTYRRARAALLASGELVLRRGTGGRGNTNCWEIRDPRSGDATLRPGGQRRVAPPVGARPLVATVPTPPPTALVDDRTVAEPAIAGERVASEKGGQNRTVSVEKGPDLTGVSGVKGGQNRTVSAKNGPDLTGVSGLKGGQNRTLSAETPAQTPAKTPAPNARAGSEPQNPRTLHPPNPPEGGSDDQLFVEETYVTERGRRRRRVVALDVASVRARLGAAGVEDSAVWERVRGLLRHAVGGSTFEIWLEPLELIAIDGDGSLVVAAPQQTRGWVERRFERVLVEASGRAGRRLRIASEVERAAVETLDPAAAAGPTGAATSSRAATASGGRVGAEADAPAIRVDMPAEAGAPAIRVDLPVAMPNDTPRAVRADRSAHTQVCPRTYRSAYPSSYTDVYTETREVSS